MRGLLFGGDSFTWGQGLYYYSDLYHIEEPPKFTFDGSLVTDAHKRYMESVRFSRLVANHFETFDFSKLCNGGSEDESFDFFEIIFNHNLTNKGHLSDEKFYYDDFEYLILQTSAVARNKFNFTYEGIEYSFPIIESEKDIEIFYKWLTTNNINFDEWLHDFCESQTNRIKEKLMFYESKGIKTKLMCYEDDRMEFILSDEWLKSRLITFTYEGKEYNTIRTLMEDNGKFIITNDFDNFLFPPSDLHCTKKCHRIIADNIIKAIENERI